jgi:hypothetical protein
MNSHGQPEMNDTLIKAETENPIGCVYCGCQGTSYGKCDQ